MYAGKITNMIRPTRTRIPARSLTASPLLLLGASSDRRPGLSTTPRLGRVGMTGPRSPGREDVYAADRDRGQLSDHVVDVRVVRDDAAEIGDPGVGERDHALLAFLERAEDAHASRVTDHVE